jgi:hypothetical protein
MGMLLVGAVGDALGAAHEVAGMEVKIATNLVDPDFRPYSSYVGRKKSEPFGVWPRAQAEELGIFTDDTSVRAMIVQQWLRAHDELELVNNGALGEPQEDNFAAWLDSMIKEPTHSVPASHRDVFTARYAAMNEIWLWIDTERKSRAAPGSVTAAPGAITKFWSPDKPTVFGQFLYLELAAIYGGTERAAVLSKFRKFTPLDHSYAGFSTGMLAAILAGAIASNGEVPFQTFFKTSAEELLKDNAAPVELKTAWELGKSVGTANVGKGLPNILADIKTKIYLAREANKDSFGKFDTALFLAQMSAAVHWSENCYDALCALAFGVGDSDTIPAQLGSIMGAYYGERAWRDAGMGKRFDLVSECLEHYFAESYLPPSLTPAQPEGRVEPLLFGDIADCVVRLAGRYGCQFR